MIQSFVQRVRDWSPFVKFVLVVTLIVFLFDLIASGDYRHAVFALYAGATMVAAGEFIAPVVSSALFSRLHERSRVPAYCGDPAEPTAADWHRVITSTAGTYMFIVGSTALLRWELSAAMLTDALLFMAPWAGLFLFVYLVFQAVHFLGHRRNYREELALREAEVTSRKFWEMMRDHKPDPGSVS